MKRIMNMLLLIILVSMIKIGVKAENFYEDNYLSGIYVTYSSSTVYKPQQMRYIRRTSDNAPVYCLTPSKILYYDEFYYENNNYNISNEKLKRVSEIAYFGYGYKNHNSDKWYAITQFMIWKEMDSNNISFTDSYDGNKISKFTDEENEINRLIYEYNKQLPLSDMKIKYNESYSVINEDIKNYDIYSDLEIIRYSDTSDSFIVHGNQKGDFVVNLVNKDGDYSTPTTIYTASRGQDIIIRGAIEKPTHSFNVNVSLGTLVIGKFPSDGVNDISVSGAEYDIYNSNNTLVTSTTIGDDGYAYVDLKYGDYYIQETKNPDGYKLDNEKHHVTVNDEYIYLDLFEDKIEVDLNIHKKLENDQDEPDVTFDIYNQDDMYIKSVTTDTNGNINTKLTYGKYRIKQLNTTKYYDKVDDIDIEINNNNSINLELTNKLIDSKLVLYKLDTETCLPISHPAEFLIKDLINDKYVGNYTTLDGMILIDIKAGLYRLYEISSPYGYSRIEPIDFEVLDYNPVILDVFNEKEKPIIKQETIEEIKESEEIKEPEEIIEKENIEESHNIEEINIEKVKEETDNTEIEEEAEYIKTIYPKTSHIEESIVVSIVYVVFIAGMYLYAKHKEK